MPPEPPELTAPFEGPVIAEVEKGFDVDFSTVLASSVHDMKNSLAMMLGGMEALSDRCGPCPVGDDYRKLQYEGRRITGQLVQLLGMYRMQHEHYALNLHEHNVTEWLEELFLDHEGLLALKGISLELNCPEDLFWILDRELVGGILGSVINNAYRYARTRVLMAATEVDGMLEITVEDDGPGYPMSMLADADGERSPLSFTTGSSGLGLYFARATARAHVRGGTAGRISTSNGGIDGGGRFGLILP